MKVAFPVRRAREHGARESGATNELEKLTERTLLEVIR